MQPPKEREWKNQEHNSNTTGKRPKQEPKRKQPKNLSKEKNIHKIKKPKKSPNRLEKGREDSKFGKQWQQY